MKLSTKICPNRCKDPKSKSANKRQRMIITSSIEDDSKPLHQVRTLIDWKCPVCAETFPVSANDLSLSSRHPKSDIAAGHRGSYGLKTKSEQK